MTRDADIGVPPCGAYCPGDCGWNPSDPDDPCVISLRQSATPWRHTGPLLPGENVIPPAADVK